MPIELSTDLQPMINLLLKEDREWDGDLAKQRNEILNKIRDMEGPKREDINNYILNWLDKKNPNQWQRSWAISALAQLGCQDGQDRVKNLMTPQGEPDPWTRYFALINGACFKPFPEAEILAAATSDPESLPKATAMRLLVAHGSLEYESGLLAMLQSQQNQNECWAAARALRTRTDLKMDLLPSDIEKDFISTLVEIAERKYIPWDTRWECIQTLISFSEKKIVTSHLAGMLVKDPDATIRRYCLDALIELNEKEEAKEALLKAVEDEDAAIQLKAARALKSMVGGEESIKRLVPEALKPEKDKDVMLDALRRIDKERAANALREALGHPDIQISKRASELLTDLGGQAAAQILLAQRTKALDLYTSLLSNADTEVRQHFGQLMSQARWAFWISMGMHVVIFVIGVVALMGSLILALNGGEKSVSTWAAGAVGVASLLLTSFYKNPLQNVRGSLNALMQVDVVFLGYVRQINQIDATFKHLFLEPQGFGTPQMKEIVVEIQNTVSLVLEEIKKYITDKPEVQKQEVQKQEKQQSGA